MPRCDIHVGIVGAGIGGIAAGIAIARAGAQVTILEAAAELGEIGAGIQMAPNVSRFLLRWGVDSLIGDNLVVVDEFNTYTGPDAKLVARTDPKAVLKNTGFPWWLVRRDHLLAGLSKSAVQHGVRLIENTRVQTLSEESDTGKVKVTTTAGQDHTFDLVVGSDGIRSTVRQHLFPGVVPVAPSKVAAYRGVLSYEEVLKAVPEARHVLRNTMDIWNGPNGYVLTYPISGGKELNVVTGFVRDDYVTTMQEVDIDEFRGYYKGYDPVIQKVLELVKYTQRWPLLQMPPLKRWSNENRNIVLLGDSAHCMQNHMAQGAATAIEDGAFMGRVLSEAVRGVISTSEAVALYEQRRIPKARIKQQISFASGLINLAGGEEKEARDRASLPEVESFWKSAVRQEHVSPTYRSWQYYCNPDSIPSVFYYDAEADADNAVLEHLQKKTEVDEREMFSLGLKEKWLGALRDNGVDGLALDELQVAHEGLTEADYKRFGKGL